MKLPFHSFNLLGVHLELDRVGVQGVGKRVEGDDAERDLEGQREKKREGQR